MLIPLIFTVNLVRTGQNSLFAGFELFLSHCETVVETLFVDSLVSDLIIFVKIFLEILGHVGGYRVEAYFFRLEGECKAFLLKQIPRAGLVDSVDIRSNAG